MEVIVSGRHTYVPETFRATVTEKLDRLEALAPKATAIEVEISHENNPKLTEARLRVEVTVIGQGPVIRAEAAANDALGAFDLALQKLQERLRRNRDKAKNHHAAGINGTPKESIPFNAANLEKELKKQAKAAKAAVANEEEVFQPRALDAPDTLLARLAIGQSVEARLDETPVTVRKKVHAGERISISEALERMELLGHDFYLFIHDATNRPSAIYKRHGWSYGVIELEG